MARLWLLVSLVGCIDAQLVPCGADVCPKGDVCVADRCASPDQLTACAGSQPGAACTIGTSVGRCDDAGICIAVGCGNGVVDPGEVCDDGNVQSHDGCSGTCLSDETCGNGVLDVVTGESCDCGRDAATMPASCSVPNSDSDLSAPCTASCQLRRCGDGVVGGPEQCDGSVDASITCADFGYYTGAVSCSSICQFDPTTCSGRCGDGVVDAGHEDCDGLAPQSESCLDFGFDLGPLGCSNVCTPGLDGCDRFNWSRVYARVSRAIDVTANSDRVAILYADASAVLLDHGIENDPPAATYVTLAGSATTTYAVATTGVYAYTSAGGWTLITATWPAMPKTAWASDGDGLFVAFANRATVMHWTGAAWQNESLPGTFTTPRFGGGRTVCFLVDVGTTNAVQWTAGGFATFFGPSAALINDLAESTNLYFATSPTGIYVRPMTSLTWAATSTLGADRVVTNSTSGVDVLAGDTLLRFGGGGFEIPAPSGSIAIAEDNGKSYAVGTAAGAFGLLKGLWVLAAQPPTTTPPPWQRVRYGLGTNVLLVGPTSWLQNSTGGWTQVNVDPTAVDAIARQVGDPISHVSVSPMIVEVTPVAGASRIIDTTIVDPKALWRQVDPVLASHAFAVGNGGAIDIDLGAQTISETALPANLTAVDGNRSTDIFSVGADPTGVTGEIWHFDGTTWTQLVVPANVTLPPLASVYVAPDDTVFAVGRTDFIIRTVGNVWTDYPIPGAALHSVSGTSASDVFFAGSVQFGFPFSGIGHYDGKNLYPIRMPEAGVAHSLYVEPSRIFVLVERESDSADDVWGLARSAPW